MSDTDQHKTTIRCDTCQGSGTVDRQSEWTGGTVERTCPACAGTGRAQHQSTTYGMVERFSPSEYWFNSGRIVLCEDGSVEAHDVDAIEAFARAIPVGMDADFASEPVRHACIARVILALMGRPVPADGGGGTMGEDKTMRSVATEAVTEIERLRAALEKIVNLHDPWEDYSDTFVQIAREALDGKR